MSAVKILVIPGSLRSGSLNAKLAAVAAHALVQEGAEITRISLSDFPLPIYDGDLQAKSGVPKHAVNLKRMMAAHHGVLIVTPEYNSSVPALVKNTIDWVSRVQDVHETRGQVFRERVFAIASASGGRLGGSRARLDRGLHGLRKSVHGEEGRAQPDDALDAARHRIADVVQLEIDEDLLAAIGEPADQR